MLWLIFLIVMLDLIAWCVLGLREERAARLNHDRF
jgi:hypothetical protein